MQAECIFLTWVSTPEEMQAAIRLEASLREFGAQFMGSPFWVMVPHKPSFDPAAMASATMFLYPYSLPGRYSDYPLADKVFACAQGETLTEGRAQTLVCMAPDTLLVGQPLLYSLTTLWDAAVRPVHIRNIGLPIHEPLDAFWSWVYHYAGIEDFTESMESFVDGQVIRFYINSAAWSIRPEIGMLRYWSKQFAAALENEEFQTTCCADQRHRIFLHQALLSALIGALIPAESRRILPPTYNYPYNLQASIPPERKAQALDELVSIVYEERSLNPADIKDITLSETHFSFLAEYFRQA